MAMLTYRQMLVVGQELLKLRPFYMQEVEDALTTIQERFAKDEIQRRVGQVMPDIIDSLQNMD